MNGFQNQPASPDAEAVCERLEALIMEIRELRDMINAPKTVRLSADDLHELSHGG